MIPLAAYLHALCARYLDATDRSTVRSATAARVLRRLADRRGDCYDVAYRYVGIIREGR